MKLLCALSGIHPDTAEQAEHMQTLFHTNLDKCGYVSPSVQVSHSFILQVSNEMRNALNVS